jgi:hypothetical protein
MFVEMFGMLLICAVAVAARLRYEFWFSPLGAMGTQIDMVCSDDSTRIVVTINRVRLRRWLMMPPVRVEYRQQRAGSHWYASVHAGRYREFIKRVDTRDRLDLLNRMANKMRLASEIIPDGGSRRLTQSEWRSLMSTN